MLAKKTIQITKARKLLRLINFLDKPQNFFLIAGGLFVLLFIFINPPFQAVDEQIHFYRIAELGEGHLVARKVTINGHQYYGDSFPAYQNNEVNKLLGGVDPITGKYDLHLIKNGISPNVSDATPTNVQFAGSAVYSPVTYLPHVIGYDLSRIITKSPLIELYAARLGNALAWLLLIYLAIRIIPFGKWTLTAIALSPQVVFAGSTIQADAFVISLCTLFIAYILYLRYSKSTIKWLDIVALVAIMSGIALAKFAYDPLLLLIFLIPSTKLKHSKSIGAAMLAFAVLVSAAWEFIVRKIAANLALDTNGAKYGPNQQIHYLSHHPFTWLHALANSMFSSGSDHLIREAFGVFTWFYIEVPLWVQILSIGTIGLALLYQLGRSLVVPKPAKTIVVLAYVGIVVLIYSTFYLLWTPAGANTVLGLQGRYFLPLLPLLIPLFTARQKVINLSQKHFVRLVQGTSLIGLVTVVIVLSNKFY